MIQPLFVNTKHSSNGATILLNIATSQLIPPMQSGPSKVVLAIPTKCPTAH